MNAERKVGREYNNQDVINNFDSLEEHVLASAIPRKRGRCVENHKRQRVKKLRYSGEEKCLRLGAYTRPGAMQYFAIQINSFRYHGIQLRQIIFQRKKTDKCVQDAYLLILLNIPLPNRRQTRVEMRIIART